MTKRLLTCCAVVSGITIACSAFAQKQPLPISQAKSIQPIRMAKVDSAGRRIGPWIRVNPYAQQTEAAFSVAYDTFEAEDLGVNPGTTPNVPNPAEVPQYGPALNGANPGNRYYFGLGYRNPFTANDMKVAAGKEGALSTRIDLAWFWEGAPGERCILIVNTAEDFDHTGAGPSVSNGFDGVAYDFGTTLTSGSFYVSRADLTGTLSHKMPVDGQGGFTLVIANDMPPMQAPVLASMAQPMLWLTKVNNPSSQNENQWDDDAPTDGTHTAPAEFYQYDGHPNDTTLPLGAMIAFYTDSAGPSILPPSDFTVVWGVDQIGGLPELLASDDTYLTLRQQVIRSRTDPGVQVIFDATVPDGPVSGLSFTIEAKTTAAPPENLTQRIELFNFATSTWVVVGSQGSSSTDVVQTGAATGNMADFLEPGTRRIRGRAGWFDSGTLLTRSWTVSIDHVFFTVTP